MSMICYSVEGVVVMSSVILGRCSSAFFILIWDCLLLMFLVDVLIAVAVNCLKDADSWGFLRNGFHLSLEALAFLSADGSRR